MTRYLITGVSSGIGRALTKELTSQGHSVFGIARRRRLLQNLKGELSDPSKYHFTSIDLSSPNAWIKVIKQFQKINFRPDVVIFNAALVQKDFTKTGIDLSRTRNLFETNFFSIIDGFEKLTEVIKQKVKFLFISSSSSFKGSGIEGIGYPASKSALSVAFESLYQKYKDSYILKILYFGPVNIDETVKRSTLVPVLSLNQAVTKVIRCLDSKESFHYAPSFIFILLKLVKFLPDSIYFQILTLIDKLHTKSLTTSNNDN